MPRKYSIPLTALFSFLVLLVAGAFAYDNATSQTISPGVTVAGIDVGGLSAVDARSKLNRDLLGQLETPVTVTRGPDSWYLAANRSKVGVDTDGSVSAALAKSNSGNFAVRAYRKLTGTELDASIQPQVSYSKPAVQAFVDRVVKGVDRPARDASLAFTVSAVQPVPSKSGVAVKQRQLKRQVTAALITPGADRTVTAQVRVLKPKITTSQLSAKYPLLITVDRNNFKLTLFKDLKPVKTYPITVGRAGFETPAGLYSIQNKQVNPTWYVPDRPWAGDLAGTVVPPGPTNPLKARWMGIAGGAGIHGTAEAGSLGTAASHGCVRMSIPDVIDLYDRVSVGTPVFIA